MRSGQGQKSREKLHRVLCLCQCIACPNPGRIPVKVLRTQWEEEQESYGQKLILELGSQHSWYNAGCANVSTWVQFPESKLIIIIKKPRFRIHMLFHIGHWFSGTCWSGSPTKLVSSRLVTLSQKWIVSIDITDNFYFIAVDLILPSTVTLYSSSSYCGIPQP